MKMPNGYGSVVKLSGKRRRPYAVRTSDITEYVNVYLEEVPAADILRELKRLGFQWISKKSHWSAMSTDRTREYAAYLKEEYSIETDAEFRQTYKFHGYFEKPELAYSLLSELNNGNVIEEHRRFTDSPTFAEMYSKWSKYKKSLKKKLSDETWRNYDIAYNHFGALHGKKFIAIRTSDIQEVLNSYNHKSASTIGNMRSIIKQLYSYALMNNYVDTDMTKFLIYEWTDAETEIHSPYTTEEIGKLWNNLYEINNVDILLIYIYTGMRPTELLNILVENVHLEEQYMVGGMKTEAGIDRIIPIADKILPLVKNRYNKDRKYLINNKYGNHYTYGTYVSANFNTVMNRLNMQHIPHDSRHTFATLMDKAGANDVCTKLIMGHSLRNDVTKGVYTHKSIADLLCEVNKI